MSVGSLAGQPSSELFDGAQCARGVDKGTRIRANQHSAAPWLLLAPALGLLALFFVVPVLWLVRVSFYERPLGGGFYLASSFTTDHYATILTDPYYRTVGFTTLRLALVVTVTALLVAYPLAVYLTRATPRLRTGALLAILLSKLTNLLVVMYGALVLLANAGPINSLLLWTGAVSQPLPMFANLFAVVFGETLVLAPYPTLILASALHGVDPTLERAALGLGASPLRAFYEVSFKLTLPSLVLATLLTFVWALGAFTAPVVLGNPELYTVAVDVFTLTFEDVNWPLGAALSVLYTVAVTSGVLATYRLQRRIERGLDRG
ncbi:MAG: ABC transporter permease [Chloroflexi bacterium]|nr:ABC transporter permease [Chloroflexota bacterium]